jgi:hypothetical protein
MLITPEHDQSIVTQCRLYEGIGDTVVCHKSVKIARIDVIDQTALTGEGIFRIMFMIKNDDARRINRTTTVMDEIGL